MSLTEPNRPRDKSAPTQNGLPNDVLVVEDDLIIALDVEESLRQLGIRSVRTAAHVAKALELIAARAPDFALLNVNLGDETSLAIVERLDTLRVPLAFLTGYGARAASPEWFARRPKLDKPYSTDVLEALLLSRGRVLDR
jgi:ActR/RegA family two-component response regulator